VTLAADNAPSRLKYAASSGWMPPLRKVIAPVAVLVIVKLVPGPS